MGVDYRFLLANERTFLAYVRTALALQVAGLGVLQFLTQGPGVIRAGLGLVLVLVGSSVGVLGHRRWRRNDVAMRTDAELDPPTALPVVALLVAAVPLLGAVAVVLW